ncbi:prolyl 4-hydroxylase subunit alpha-1-like [Drosophila subpulchrella]|uniref:prolyl 4-hydroxylase subunit alpha-1-like n=1 Tax=Drosophila subpulchrella TaxID=1486046 RepID=UPI0018A16312|nr:prolyl 4-hydroxylase subunit alpha-1-like [Drosophila subpulchrella]
MLIGSLVLLGIISQTLSSEPVLEEDKKQRYSRSVVTMDELLVLEDYLTENLGNFAEWLSRKAITIRSGIYQMKKRHLAYRKHVFNPFESYSLIRHMQSDWLMWQLFLEKPVGQDQLAYVESIKSKLPQQHDFFDAAEGLRKLQATYMMATKDVAKGLLDGVQYNSYLASIDCLAMANHLLDEWWLPEAEGWILSGIEAHDRGGSQTEMQLLRGPLKTELYRTQGKVRNDQENYMGALQAYQTALKHSPHDSKIFMEYRNLERRVLMLSGIEPEDEEEEADDIQFLPACCSGRCEVVRQLKRLYCVYNHVTAPFLRLSPIKTEILSIEPFVAFLHDMVSKKEGALIRSSSKKHLLPSAVAAVDAPKEEYRIASSRTSKSVWYPNDFNNATLKISERLEEATGLNMFHTEYFQVMNYGLGGYFETHIDMLLSNETRFNGTRDRIATALLYLSDVPQGGGTHFPKLNLTVFPKAGSVLFWYNLDFKGNDAMNTLHTGCPVIVGSKWVVSKWVTDMGQEFRRPCTESISNAKHFNSVEKLLM